MLRALRGVLAGCERLPFAAELDREEGRRSEGEEDRKRTHGLCHWMSFRERDLDSFQFLPQNAAMEVGMLVLEALASLSTGDQKEPCGHVLERGPCNDGVGAFEVLSGFECL